MLRRHPLELCSEAKRTTIINIKYARHAKRRVIIIILFEHNKYEEVQRTRRDLSITV